MTEIRPGVYMFFDLAQARLGVCSVDDIAVSVLATVIGHHREAGHLLVDAGAQVRILPNHACMTVAPYPEYHVLDSRTGVLAQWSKAHGW